MTFPMPMVPSFHAPDVPASIEFVEDLAYGTTATSSYSASIDIGDAASDRLVIICVGIYRESGAAVLSSATIGGVVATINIQRNGNTVAGRWDTAAIISAVVPTGTSATVVMNFTLSNIQYIQLSSFRVIGLLSATPVDTDSSFQSAHVRSVSLDVTADGILVATTQFYADQNILWGGITGRYTRTTFNYRTQGASDNVSANVSGKVITMTRATGASHLTTTGPAVAASFR